MVFAFGGFLIVLGGRGAACGPHDVLLRQHDAGPGAHDVQLRCMMFALRASFNNVKKRLIGR